jgi:hypothetical protein
MTYGRLPSVNASALPILKRIVPCSSNSSWTKDPSHLVSLLSIHQRKEGKREPKMALNPFNHARVPERNARPVKI